MLSLTPFAPLLAQGAETPDVPSRWRPPDDPRLRQSLAMVERGLSQQNLVLLADLLPHRDKVLVRWEHPVRQEGLFTGSQVVLLFHELFKEYRTERFAVQSGFLQPPGAVYHCMARWIVRGSGGESQSVELHFSLREDAGAWTIRELRQIR